MMAIKVEKLTRDYNGVRAIDNITFSVRSGEVFGFLGPNGAGKSTTIRILTGQLRPTSGTAAVMGCDVISARDRMKPRIGVVFEHQNLYSRDSGRGNLRFYARLYGVGKARVEELLKEVGLEHRAGDRVKGYSNGMKQRLLIARALLHRPQVLFLDEPTRGLDPNVARDIRNIVSELSQRGVTIFLTTHYMEEADRLCDRVAILNRGRIVALDSPANLKASRSKNGDVTLEDVFVFLTGDHLRWPA